MPQHKPMMVSPAAALNWPSAVGIASSNGRSILMIRWRRGYESQTSVQALRRAIRRLRGIGCLQQDLRKSPCKKTLNNAKAARIHWWRTRRSPCPYRTSSQMARHNGSAITMNAAAHLQGYRPAQANVASFLRWLTVLCWRPTASTFGATRARLATPSV